MKVVLPTSLTTALWIVYAVQAMKQSVKHVLCLLQNDNDIAKPRKLRLLLPLW